MNYLVVNFHIHNEWILPQGNIYVLFNYQFINKLHLF